MTRLGSNDMTPIYDLKRPNRERERPKYTSELTRRRQRRRKPDRVCRVPWFSCKPHQIEMTIKVSQYKKKQMCRQLKWTVKICSFFYRNWTVESWICANKGSPHNFLSQNWWSSRTHTSVEETAPPYNTRHNSLSKQALLRKGLLYSRGRSLRDERIEQGITHHTVFETSTSTSILLQSTNTNCNTTRKQETSRS